MKVEEQKLLNESLSKLFKLDPETLASLYNEAGELTDFSKILELDQERVKKFKADSDSQFKRGVKETMLNFEKELKEKYEVDSDLKGVDLINHLVAKAVDETETSSTKDITKHPEYIKLQVSIEKQLKDRDKEWEVKLIAKDEEFKKEKLFEGISKKGLLNLDKRNPILPTDPLKAQYWRDAYINELKKGNYMDNGENPVVLDAEGKPLQDAHGNPITFDQFTNEIADKIFEFPVAEQRSGSGNKHITTTGTDGFIPPKDEADYMARQRDPKITSTERIKLSEYWLSKNKLQ